MDLSDLFHEEVVERTVADGDQLSMNKNLISQGGDKMIEYKRKETGEVWSVALVNHHPLWANYLWNGAHWMSDRIDSRPDTVKGRSVVELGAGAGLPSIMAVKAGSSNVLVTDYPDEELMVAMRKNTENLLSTDERKRIRVDGLLWGQGGPEGEKFDCIIMCDLIFNHSEHAKFIKSMRSLIANESGEIWCVFSHYRSWCKKKDFELLRMAKEGLGEDDAEPEKVFSCELVDRKVYDFVIIEDDRADPMDLRTVYAYLLKPMWF